jgi:CRP-like cAMP-binding protein
LDGYGVIHLLGKNIETARIPFIFLTAKSERNDFRKGMELGADDYIMKPFSDTELLNSIEARLRKVSTSEGTIDQINHRIQQIKSRNFNWIEVLSELSGKFTRTYGKREVVFSEGDTCQNLYVVLKGKVKLYKSHDLGKDLILRVRGKGDIFAFSSLFQGDIHLDSAETLESTELMMIPKASFFNWLEQNPKMLLEMIHLFSTTLELERDRAVQLAYSSVRKRTANALIRLKLRFHNENEGNFSMPISRDDLAAIVGTATESVIRTLSVLKDEKLRRMKN